MTLNFILKCNANYLLILCRRLSIGNPGLTTIFSFEPYAICDGCKGFPIYQKSNIGNIQIYDDTYFPANSYPVSASTNPAKCGTDEYYSGTKCKSTNVLYISRGITPGLVIPIKTRYANNLEWTIELWAFVISDTLIASIEGDNCIFSIQSKSGQLSFGLLYGLTGISNQINATFTLNAWHYIVLTARVESPYLTLEAILDSQFSNSTSIILPSVRQNFKYFVLGASRTQNTLTGSVALKEIRLWNIAFSKDMLKNQIRSQIKQSNKEVNLVNYFKIESNSQEELMDSGFEGELLQLKLWNTPHNYSFPISSSDPSTIVPPQIAPAFTLGIPPLIICDENSYYHPKKQTCEKDEEEYSKTLDLSIAQFSIPLDNFYFDYEWTIEFWLLIREISGINTMIIEQYCVPENTGAITFKKVGTSDNLVFYQSNMSQNFVFPQVKRKWVHYAFMNSVINQSLSMYVNGIHNNSDIQGLIQPILNCPILIGEISTMNLIFGRLREFRIWNGTRTANEIYRSMHKKIYPYIDNRLVFNLPLNEGQGNLLTEEITNAQIKLNADPSIKELWVSQGDLHICRTPYIYSLLENVCICIIFILIL